MATVTLTEDLVQKALREVDWARVDATTDGDIDRQIADDADTAPITLPSHVASARVAAIRARLGLSMAGFSVCFGIPVATLEAWEHDRQVPDQLALSYLRVIAAEPDVVAKALVAA